MAKQEHIHKLRRHKYKSGNVVFFCILPKCHYRMDVALTLGKETLCNICDEVFIINEYTLKLAKPHCSNCGKVKIRGADGKNRFVKKVTDKILTGMAEDARDDLRSRLDNATSADMEHDI